MAATPPAATSPAPAQRVDVLLEDGTELEDCTVFNAEEIEIPEPHADKRIDGLRLLEASSAPRPLS